MKFDDHNSGRCGILVCEPLLYYNAHEESTSLAPDIWVCQTMSLRRHWPSWLPVLHSHFVTALSILLPSFSMLLGLVSTASCPNILPVQSTNLQSPQNAIKIAAAPRPTKDLGILPARLQGSLS